MTARRKQAVETSKALRRERGAFTEEFKREAVRLLHERPWRASATRRGSSYDGK